MSDGIDQLRVDLARERGLPDGAATFLEGRTVAEVEAQADTLAVLLGTTHAAGEPEPAPAPNPFVIASAQKERRKRELAAMFTGRTPQPRDARGRFASGFDGGARLPVIEPSDALRDHDRFVGDALRDRRADAGRWL
jgi:hypothetical protein